MASFRTGIKIISDVSKRQGRVLLQRSISAEHLLGINSTRGASDNRSSSPTGLKTSDEEHQHMTDVVAAEKPWFSNFNDRQDKEAQAPKQKRKVAPPQPSNGTPGKNKFLVPNTETQVPNRYYSTSYDYCKKDPPAIFKGPPPNLRDCHKDNSKPCFMDMFQPKVDVKVIPEVSPVSCSAKQDKSGKFCEGKSTVKSFSACPKPIPLRPTFRCPEAPKITTPPRKLIDKCEESKPPPFKVCPKPPPRKLQPMCLALSGKIEKPPEPKPPPTPRRCVCADDPEFMDARQPPPLYKMNPEIPFPVCPKRKLAARKPYKWASTNQVCKGEPGGSCAMNKCDENKLTKTAACRSIRGEPCVDEHPCPYHPHRPPPPPPKTCGPVSRPAFPTGPYTSTESDFTDVVTARKEPSTKSAPSTATSRSSQLPSSSAAAKSATSTATSRGKQFPSSTSAPKKVQSLTSATTKKSSSYASAPRSLSASASASRATLSITSTPKPSGSAASKSQAGSISQPKKSSNKTSNAMALKQSSKRVCTKMAFSGKKDKSKSAGKCDKIRLPGCRVPTRTDCGTRRLKKKKCTKIPVPTPCFSDCYKGPCPPKMCTPCPCVHLPPLTECDILFKTRHLQPKEPIFDRRDPFRLPAPAVELFVDPSIGACCEASKTPAPAAIPCTPTCAQPSAPAPAPGIKEEKSGCDCKFINFFRSLLGLSKGDSKTCEPPPDACKKEAQKIEAPPEKEGTETKAKPKSASSAMDPSCRDKGPRGKDPRPKKVKKSSEGKCDKLKLPGCKPRVREDCTVEKVEKTCKKRLAPRPSFSECVRDDFPSLPCTECRIALKRAKSLSELRDKGLRVTPENLRVHCSMCLNPTSKGCEIATKKLDCFKLSHQCKLSSCTRMGVASPKGEKTPEKEVTKNPPRPTREYCGPRAEPKKCDKPPAGLKKDCKNIPSRQDATKNLPCNTLDEKPPNNPRCDVEEELCDAPEPYRMPKEDCEEK